MDMYYEEDTGGATYRSGDPIKNLHLRITLQRVSPSIQGLISRPGTAGGSGSDNDPSMSASAANITEFGQTILEEEILDCCWQKKYFSAREFELYSQAQAPVGDSAQLYKYRGEIQKLKDSGGRHNTRLFSYCDGDELAPADEFSSSTTSPNELPTYLAKTVNGLRRRKPDSSAGNALSAKLKQGQGAGGLKIVIKAPSDEFRQNNHVVNTPIRRYQVIGDLGPEGQLGDPGFEICLCQVEHDENGVLRITPDFTRGKLPYRAQSRLSRDIWLYKIESASATMSRMEMQKEAKMMKQLYNKHQKYLSELVGSEFEDVKAGQLRLVINGEIVSAQSFEYDDLHVEYFLDLPRNWYCDARDMLSGCTHSCSTKLENNIEVAYFSQPFSFDLFLVHAREDTKEVPQEWPNIYLHVIATDSWGRRRTEGYGWVALPSTAGYHVLRTQCWRPIGNPGREAINFELRRFFTGISAELEDKTYVAVPSTFEGKILNKYGMRTESTGSVTLRVNCMTQRQPEPIKPDSVPDHLRKRKQQTALRLAEGRAANDAIHNVLAAFLKAKKRMQAARETVPEHIRRTAEERSKQSVSGEKAQRLSDLLSGQVTWRAGDDNSVDGETTA